jgi:dipeptidyl aminopeptidase/acylaminoacyl peptidase
MENSMLKHLSVFFLVLELALAGTGFAQAGAPSAEAKRPMTFEDLMAMKRLGETAVSPDGKWLAYSVTTVDLGKNTKTPELWLQKIEGGDPIKIAVAQPGDGGPEFAPDNKRILFTSSRDGSQQIWLADFDAATGAASNAKKLTSIATEADNARWSPDGKSIVFTSAVYPDCAPITTADGTGNACNSDRDKAAAASKVKAQIFTHLLYRHWNHFTGDKRSHLFIVSLDSGPSAEGSALRDLNPNDPRDVPPFSLEGGGGFSISPDSKELAFTENLDPEPASSTNADIFTLDLTDAHPKPVKISTSPGGDFNPAYSPDGKYIAWRSQARAGYESDKFRLMLYDRAAKTTNDLLPKFDQWVDEIAWASDSKKIYFVSGHEGYAPVFAIQESGIANNGMGLERFETPNQGFAEYSGLHVLPDSKRLLASRMTVQVPSEVVLLGPYTEPELNPGEARVGADFVGSKQEFEKLVSLGEPENRSLSLITHLNDSLLEQFNIPAMESFWFTAKDGVKVEGFLIRPPAFDASKKYPVKFLIHGGPQGAWGDAWSYRWNAELFAASGYVVVMINPRGSTGYGQPFVDGVNGDWGGKPFTDLMTGLDYAEQHYPFIDKSRECALGASYGGYMANWVLGHTDRFKCIVSHDGMFNAESAFGSTEEDWFNNWEFKGNPWDYYGKPDNENPFRKWSPSLYAKNFKTPTLVIHGQLDYRLDVSEGYQFFDTLQLLKVPSKMLYFPDEGHWVLKPQNSRLWYKTVNDWVDQWTRGSGQ